MTVVYLAGRAPHRLGLTIGTRVAVLIAVIALGFAVRSEGTENERGIVRIQNHVQDCIEIGGLDWQLFGPIEVLSAKLQCKKHLGSCGCTSALLKYIVFEEIHIDGSTIFAERGSGVISSLSKDHASFVIRSDPNVSRSGTVVVDVACMPPD